MLSWNRTDRILRWVARGSVVLFLLPGFYILMIIFFLFLLPLIQQLADNSYDGKLKADDVKEVCGTVGSTCTVSEGTTTSVALDDSACIALSGHEIQKQMLEITRQAEAAGLSGMQQRALYPPWNLPADNERSYAAAVRRRSIVSLKAGLKTKFVKGLYSEYGKLIPPHSITGNEMRVRGAVDMSIVSIAEGPLKGKLVCLPSNRTWPRWGPWP